MSDRFRIEKLIKASSLGDAAWIDCPVHGHTARDPYSPEWCVSCLAEENTMSGGESYDCACGHRADWHIHGADSWGECDAFDCDCQTYHSWLDDAQEDA